MSYDPGIAHSRGQTVVIHLITRQIHVRRGAREKFCHVLLTSVSVRFACSRARKHAARRFSFDHILWYVLFSCPLCANSQKPASGRTDATQLDVCATTHLWDASEHQVTLCVALNPSIDISCETYNALGKTMQRTLRHFFQDAIACQDALHHSPLANVRHISTVCATSKFDSTSLSRGRLAAGRRV